MNTATYKSHPTQQAQVQAKYKPLDLNPAQKEINKCIGSFQINASIEEDVQTNLVLKHIPGLIAFLCTLRIGNNIIGQGRGTGVLNRTNRFVERTANFAKNASLIDAIVRSTKILDAFSPSASSQDVDEAFKLAYGFDEPITDKQKSYLQELIQINVLNDGEREHWTSQLPEMTKQEASEAIQSFVK